MATLARIQMDRGSERARSKQRYPCQPLSCPTAVEVPAVFQNDEMEATR